MTPLGTITNISRNRLGTAIVVRLGRWMTPLMFASCCLSSGCASLQDSQYEQSQYFRGLIEYYRRPDGNRAEYPSDYRRGWLDGFNEVVTGGPNCPPAIAPKRYWDPKQILKKRDQRRHDYYSGWQDGAAKASSLPDTHFLKVFESPECPFPKCGCEPNQCHCGASTVNAHSAVPLLRETILSDTILGESIDSGTSFMIDDGVNLAPTN